MGGHYLLALLLLYCNLTVKAMSQPDLPLVLSSPPHQGETMPFPSLCRDVISFTVTLLLGLPVWNILYIIPMLACLSLKQLCHGLPSTPIKKPLSCVQLSKRTEYSRDFIILLLMISGNVHLNPGPGVSPGNDYVSFSHLSDAEMLTFNGFCNRKSLGLMHLNIRSLLPKLDELKAYMHTSNPDVLVISESWLKKSVTTTAVSIPGYNVFRQDRPSKGGGVAIYCKDSLQCSVILSKSVSKQFELLLLKVNLSRNISLIVAGCYRPPSAPACALTALSELIAPHTSSEFVLLGDLNWDMLSPPHSVQLQLDALNLCQIVQTPTRFNSKSMENGTLIDVILTNMPDKYTPAVFCQGLSDHCCIACVRKGTNAKRPPLIIFKRLLKNFNEQAFLHDLALEEWHRMDLIPTVEDAWSFFKTTFSTILNRHAPFIKIRTKNRYSPWFSTELSEMIRQKHLLWHKAKASKNTSDWQCFRGLRNKCTQSIRKAKANYYKQQFTTCGPDPKLFWKTVKTMENKNTSSQLPTAIKSEDIVISDKAIMVDCFNKHFVRAGHAFAAATPTSTANLTASGSGTGPPLDTPNFSFQPVEEREVLRELLKLDPYKSAGLDDLDPFFFKLAAYIVSAPITCLFNLSLHTSEFPKDWKSAAVIPLFKGGDKLDLNCYRPISILPCLSKVFEKLVNNQLTNHLESHSILSTMQSGFRTGYGCVSATLKVLNDIICAIDAKHYCVAVFIDLAKAFDSVDHCILLDRLKDVGLIEECLAWFSSYFSGRVQSVKAEGLLSDPLPLSMGVPQGSILGPTLFKIYINNVAHAATNSFIHLYADDTILYTSGPSLNTALTSLQHSFNSIQYAFSNLHLLLHTKKTKCMVFNRNLPQATCPLKITSLNGSELEFVDTYKYLGIWLDSSLSFQTHINTLLTKVRTRIGFLYRNKASFTHSAKHTLVKMTILPILDYADIIYRIAPKNLLNKLDVIYHTAIRFVTGAPFNTHHCDLYSQIEWPSLHTRRQIHWYQFIYKSIIGKTPPYLRSLLNISISLRTLRSSKLITLVIPKVRTSFGRHSFQSAAPTDWNELQKSLKLHTFISLPSFNNSLHDIVSDHCTCF